MPLQCIQGLHAACAAHGAATSRASASASARAVLLSMGCTLRRAGHGALTTGHIGLTSTGTVASSAMRYLILGPLEVRDGTRVVALGQGRQRLLLALLALHVGEVLSGDRLIEELWGEHAPASAASSLHNLVSTLRKTLGDDELVTRGHGYALLAGASDAAEFEVLAARGRAALADGDAPPAAALLGGAPALWRGPALSGLAYEDAVPAAAARLDD